MCLHSGKDGIERMKTSGSPYADAVPKFIVPGLCSAMAQGFSLPQDLYLFVGSEVGSDAKV